MSWPFNDADRHFRFASEPKWRDGNARTVCGSCVPRARTLELRKGAAVDCPACMLVKDAWLELPKPKPLTVIRCRAFWRERFGGVKPILSYNRHVERQLAEALGARTPEQIAAEQRAEDERQRRAEADRASDAREDALEAAEQLVDRRERALERLERKAKRLAGAIKRAKRRHTRAVRKLEKLREA